MGDMFHNWSRLLLVITVLILAYAHESLEAAPVVDEVGVIGGWVDSFDRDLCVFFLADGRVLFVSLDNRPDEQFAVHNLGSWKALPGRRIEITFPWPRPPEKSGPPPKDIYVLGRTSNDILISPHGGDFYRSGSKADMDDLAARQKSKTKPASGGGPKP